MGVYLSSHASSSVETREEDSPVIWLSKPLLFIIQQMGVVSDVTRTRMVRGWLAVSNPGYVVYGSLSEQRAEVYYDYSTYLSRVL